MSRAQPGWQGPLAGMLLLMSGSLMGAGVAPDDPQQQVIDTTERMLTALRQQSSQLEQNPTLIYDLVKEIVVPQFDFVRMSGWVLGKHWPHASQDQKLRFVRAFRQMLVRTYAVALLEYQEQTIDYLPLREDPAAGEVTVRSQVLQPGRAAIAIHYTLWERDGRWRVYDISVDGISLVANFRTSFASEIKAQGLDALITRLEQRNLSGETLQ